MEMLAESVGPPETRDGFVTGVQPVKGDGDFRVLTVEVARGKPETWVGTFQATGRGTRVTGTGAWRQHPRYGDQFVVETLAHVMPTTVDGIARYLGIARLEKSGRTEDYLTLLFNNDVKLYVPAAHIGWVGKYIGGHANLELSTLGSKVENLTLSSGD